MRPSPRDLIALVSILFMAATGCRLAEPASGEGSAAADPALGEVSLGSRAGWDAYLLLDGGGVGVWTVRAYDVFEQHGAPEVVALDDLGRCNVLVSYSGSWTPLRAVHDGKWLAPIAEGDVDLRVAGDELYTGGQRGNVYQVVGLRSGVLDARLVAELPGYEIHTLVAGDIEPERPGEELLAFTNPGGMCFLRPTSERVMFDVEWVQLLSGRVRDALLLPSFGGGTPWIATVSRAGRVELLRFTSAGPEWRLVHEEEMGLGRLALRPLALGTEIVLYSSCDDGRVLRHAKDADGRWVTELIYAGPQGPRGVAAGRFTDDAAAECVAVFGYSGTVELLVRGAEGWSVETIFEDPGRGHWLAVAELDGRNATPEILTSGYSGRVVMLARPPGYGLRGVALEPPRAHE